MAVDNFCVINILNTTFINAFQHLFFQTSQTIQNNLKGSKMSKGGGTCIKSASANSVVVKQRWLFCILILILFVISANIGITALLLYYINVTNVRRSFLRQHLSILYFNNYWNCVILERLNLFCLYLSIASKHSKENSVSSE
jgi:hypothetical protein